MFVSLESWRFDRKWNVPEKIRGWTIFNWWGWKVRQTSSATLEYKAPSTPLPLVAAGASSYLEILDNKPRPTSSTIWRCKFNVVCRIQNTRLPCFTESAMSMACRPTCAISNRVPPAPALTFSRNKVRRSFWQLNAPADVHLSFLWNIIGIQNPVSSRRLYQTFDYFYLRTFSRIYVFQKKPTGMKTSGTTTLSSATRANATVQVPRRLVRCAAPTARSTPGGVNLNRRRANAASTSR